MMHQLQYRSFICNTLRAAFSVLLVAVVTAGSIYGQERTPDHVERPSEVRASMSGASSNAVNSIADALDLPADNVLSVDFTPSDPAGHDIFTSSTSGFPRRSGSYLAMSTGFTSVALNANTSGSTSGVLSGLTSPGGGQDMVQMRIELSVPEDASSLSFDFKFFSEEYPEFVGSAFNDGFVVEVGSSTFSVSGSTVNAPGNVVFDEQGNAITINTTGPLGMTQANASGTTYDGATPVLTTEVPIPSGADSIVLIFSIFDVGDDFYDSAVFVDNMRFNSVNLELVGLEVNQSIQDWQNSIPLVERKRTVLRSHIQNTESAKVGTNVQLRGYRGGVELPGSPLNAMNAPGFEAPAHTTTESVILNRRRDLNSSLNFNIPWSWRSGTVDLELEAVNGTLDCSQAAATNANCQLQVSFNSVPRPEVKFIRIAWTDAGGTTHQPSFLETVELASRLVTMFPIHSLDWHIGQMTWSGSPNGSLEDINASLEIRRFLDFCWEGCERLYYGDMVGTNNGGLANDIPGTVASGDRQAEPNVHAHELGHVLGRHHAANQGDNGTTTINGVNYKLGYCGAVASLSAPEFPHTNGTIATLGPMNQGLDAEMWGLDIREMQPLDPRSNGDLMSYCAPLWVSDFTYNGLRSAIEGRYGSSSPKVALLTSAQRTTSARTVQSLSSGATQEYTVVRGIVDFEENTVRFEPFVRIASSEPPPLPDDGEYDLTLLDDAGSVLEHVSFEPREYHGFGNPHPGIGSFIIPVPVDPDVSQVEVGFQGENIGSLEASANPPAVEITFPNGGESLSGDKTTLQWDASDPDGDALTYFIQYSRDGGNTWETLVADWTQQSYDVELSLLPQTSTGLIRVLASDGLHVAQDVSDDYFSTPNSGPAASIVSPTAGENYAGNAPISFEGMAFDSEEGLLQEASLEWRSNQDGPLGTGTDVTKLASELSLGTHVITLRAMDSGGQVDEVSVEITVSQLLTGGTGVAPECSEGLYIAEFDADQGDVGNASDDNGEYIDIGNTTGSALSLGGCTLAFFDGANSSSYFATQLSGTLEPGATYRIGNPEVSGTDQIFSEATLQNGPDAIAVLDLPVGDVPTGTNAAEVSDEVIASVVYVDENTVFGQVPSGAAGKMQVAEQDALPALLEAMVLQDLKQVPDEFALEQNYPNPVQSSRTTIRFSLPEAADVELVVFDMLGRVVHRLVDRNLEAGWHEVEWDGRDASGMAMPAGMYLYRLQAGQFVQTRRMMLIR